VTEVSIKQFHFHNLIEKREGKKSMKTYHPIIRGIQYLYVGVAWLFVLAIGVQVYFAGLSIFINSSWIQVHSGLGWILAQTMIVMIVLVLLGRFPRNIILLYILLIVDVIIQVGLVSFFYAFHIKGLAAFHPLNALALFLIAILLAYRSLQWVRSPSSTKIRIDQPVRNDQNDTGSASESTKEAMQ
jgi:hypothetical protein